MPASIPVPERRQSGSQIYASPSDHRVCMELHRKYGRTYFFASRCFSAETRRRVDALYGFVRVPDEWVDNPGSESCDEIRQTLDEYRTGLLRGLDGVRPESPVLRAFCDVMHELNMNADEPLIFLDAMQSDLSVTHYESYSDLRRYMRGSAVAVGRMMCTVLGTRPEPTVLDAAGALAEAMQLTNFLRDVGEDARRKRLYLPQEDLVRFGVGESDILEGQVTPNFARLMMFEIARARDLYAQADAGIPLLPPSARRGVRLARVLYSRILDRIEAAEFDVFKGRLRTSAAEKLWVAAKVLATTR